MSFFSCSLCQGLPAASDCGTPWNFLLAVLYFSKLALEMQNENLRKYANHPCVVLATDGVRLQTS